MSPNSYLPESQVSQIRVVSWFDRFTAYYRYLREFIAQVFLAHKSYEQKISQNLADLTVLRLITQNSLYDKSCS